MKTGTTYKFRLSRKDVQSGLKSHVDDLATRRVLTDEIKTALTLLAQLRNGNTALLNELFPNVCASPPTPPDSGDMERRIAEAVANRLKGELQQHTAAYEIPDSRNAGFPAMKQAGQGIGKLASHTIALPVFDDEDDGATIVLNQRTGTSNGSNLIAGVLGL